MPPPVPLPTSLLSNGDGLLVPNAEPARPPAAADVGRPIASRDGDLVVERPPGISAAASASRKSAIGREAQVLRCRSKESLRTMRLQELHCTTSGGMSSGHFVPAINPPAGPSSAARAPHVAGHGAERTGSSLSARASGSCVSKNGGTNFSAAASASSALSFVLIAAEAVAHRLAAPARAVHPNHGLVYREDRGYLELEL